MGKISGDCKNFGAPAVNNKSFQIHQMGPKTPKVDLKTLQIALLQKLHSGYRFTKELTQNLNLRKNIKLEYNIKSLNYIQHNFRFQASFLYYWTMSFTFST